MNYLQKPWNLKTAISRPEKVVEFNLTNLYIIVIFNQVLNFGGGLCVGLYHVVLLIPAAFNKACRLDEQINPLKL